MEYCRVGRPKEAVSVVVDLDAGRPQLLDTSSWRRDFLGGRGLGVRLVAEYGSPGLPAVAPCQPFVLASCPLNGSSAPSSGRCAAVSVSPLTGTIFDGNAGGRLGARLRAAGVEALVLRGAAPEWSVLVVDGREESRSSAPLPNVKMVSLRDLWPGVDPEGVELTSSRVTQGLRERLGPGFSFLFPGVAARRGVLLGSICTDEQRNFARGGLGAVLAAKHVWAVAVAGGCGWEAEDPERFAFLAYEARKLVEANPVLTRALPNFGTSVLVQLVNKAGALPVRNYRASCWERAGVVSGEAIREQLAPRRSGCFGCPIRCTRRVGAGRGSSRGPEYQTVWAFGPDCGVDNLAAIQAANRLCTELGLDAVSAGATIACAMELSEEGMLGRPLYFGDAAGMLDLLGLMGRVEGIGAELAQGSVRFTEAQRHPEAAMHVKRLELPGYDPRGMQGQGLGYATSNRGGCSSHGDMVGPEILGIPKLVDRLAVYGKAGLLVGLQHTAAVYNSAGVCRFAGFGYGQEVVARLVAAALGEEETGDDLARIGERIWNLERLWNLASGFTARDDTLPRRLLEEPVTEGPAAGHVVQLAPMLEEYYRARGWNREGRPTPDKCRDLGLNGLAASLAERAVADSHEEAREAASGPPGPGEPPAPPGPAAPPSERRRHLRAV